MSDPLLDVNNLSIALNRPSGPLELVSKVSFSLARGEMLGLVGESGSGKSLTCRALIRLLPPGLGISNGTIRVDGQDVTKMDDNGLRTLRGRKVGMVFQNPSSYLNPVMTVGRQIAEPLVLNGGLSRREARAEAIECLRQVGIPDPDTRIDSYIHEFSGGMRQRVMIAMALAGKPDILIADEPTTALDVTIQAQILRLLLDLKDRLGLAILLVTHDLSVVAQTCDSVAVMYLGRLMEQAPKADILNQPYHPYSEGLIASQPEFTRPGLPLPSIRGHTPALSALPPGCRFAPRCPDSRDECNRQQPDCVAVATRRFSACPFHKEIPA